MAYENTKIVRTLRFPGDENNQYQINATKLGKWTEINLEERFNSIEAFDALRYMGPLTASATVEGGYTPAANKGDVYKVVNKGYIMSVAVEPGDMLICSVNDTPAANSGNVTEVALNWDIIQTNIDVDSILDHYHDGTVTFEKTDKILNHSVILNEQELTAELTNGSAKVDGKHSHTAHGTVSTLVTGSVTGATLTPKGAITITVDSGSQGQGIGTNISPKGTNTAATTVTSVEAGSTTLSAHTASSAAAGAHTPSGTVSVQGEAVNGSIEAHSHSIECSATKSNFFNSVTYSAAADDEGILTFGTQEAFTGLEVTETAVPLTFTSPAHSHDATFTGNEVEAHSHDVTVNDHDSFVPTINVVSTEHTHEFQGEGKYISAYFIGSPEEHNHTFISAGGTQQIYVTVDEYTGEFSGTAEGTVTPSIDKVVTGVTIDNHTISTVNSGTVVTGKGKQE